MNWFCVIAAVDRALRTSAGAVELTIDPLDAAHALRREPRVRESKLVSFASVTLDELREVAIRDSYSPDEARTELDALIASTSARDILWLLYFVCV